MKIKITYQQHEKQQADKLVALYLEQLQSRNRISISRSDRHKPFYHIYIADKQSKSNIGSSELNKA